MKNVGRPKIYPNNAERQRAYRKRDAIRRLCHKIKVYHRSVTTEWSTPQPFFDNLNAEFNFTLDAAAQPDNAKCAQYFTPHDNGLIQSWGSNTVWLNPPFGRTVGIWIRKAYESAILGATVVCLIPARTDTIWWHTYTQYGEIRYIKGRLTFDGATNPAPFPSALIIFRPII